MTEPIELPIDLYSPEVMDDPVAAYAAIREAGSVVRLSRGYWALGRFADVKSALADWETFSSARGVSINDFMNQTITGGLLGSDPPEHTSWRKTIFPLLSPARIRSLRTRISELAEELVERLCEKGNFDAATELAAHLPLTVVSELVGLPEDGRERMLSWAKAFFRVAAPTGSPMSTQALPEMLEASEYMFAPDLPDRLRPGSWAAELYELCAKGEISSERFQGLLPALVFPSLDTTILATSSLVWLFALHPDQWEAVRQNRALISRAINEGLRLEGPIRHLTRVAVRDVEVGGVRIPEGTRVILVIGAANRDERHYIDPDRFDVTRDNADQLGFGYDTHVCVGMNLARLEMTCLVEALLKRVRRIEILREERAYSTLRGFDKLEVKVH